MEQHDRVRNALVSMRAKDASHTRRSTTHKLCNKHHWTRSRGLFLACFASFDFAPAQRQLTTSFTTRCACHREADAAWFASIDKTPIGFEKQLSLLPPASRTCLLAIYTEIHKRPENELARKVKLENAKFQYEIGQFEGGKEALVAAGWKVRAHESRSDEPVSVNLLRVTPL